MKILMIYPDYENTFWGFKRILRLLGKKASFPPLGLLTIGGMLPLHWEKKLVDMNTDKLEEKHILWADYVFVTVGSAAAAQQGFSMSGPRGMTVMVGIPPRGETITLSPFLPGEKMLTSCFMGDTRLSVDIPKLVELYKAKRIKLDEMITARYPLEKINEAIEAVEKGQALRNIIVF